MSTKFRLRTPHTAAASVNHAYMRGRCARRHSSAPPAARLSTSTELISVPVFCQKWRQAQASRSGAAAPTDTGASPLR